MRCKQDRSSEAGPQNDSLMPMKAARLCHFDWRTDKWGPWLDWVERKHPEHFDTALSLAISRHCRTRSASSSLSRAEAVEAAKTRIAPKQIRPLPIDPPKLVPVNKADTIACPLQWEGKTILACDSPIRSDPLDLRDKIKRSFDCGAFDNATSRRA